MNITIDKEFKSLIPALTDDEYKGLEQSILEEGCRDALVIWCEPNFPNEDYHDDGYNIEDDPDPYVVSKYTLIDGHNRFEICKRHNIPFDTVEMHFDSRDDVKDWIIDNQCSRRNLPLATQIALKLKKSAYRIAQAKQAHIDNGGDKKSAYRKSDTPKEKININKEIAKEVNANADTVSKVRQIEAKAPIEIKERLHSGEISINQAYQTIKQPHVAFNSGNNEWYTPKEIIETARGVMGSIDLDPASSEIANKTVKAETYYTAETNGLDKEWHGNVWMNPPYASELIGKFVDKLVEQRGNYEQAIVLVNNATETEWFNKIVDIASAVCFPKSRVKFYMPNGKMGAPLQGQAILYIGDNKSGFTSAFSFIGWCADVIR